MKNLKDNKEVQESLKNYVLWGKDEKNSVFLFEGTWEECKEELRENYDENHPDYSILQNTVNDQWENEVEGRGFVIMANKDEFEYNL